MQKTKKQAFTVAETLITLMVMGIIAAVAISALFTDKTRQEKINKTTSVTLWQNFETIYENILASKCSNKYSLANLEDINKDNSINSKDIADFIISAYMGENAACSGLVVPSSFTKPNTMTCLDIAPNGFMGVVLDTSCKTAVNANEAIGQTTRQVSGTCGYIAYSLKNSKGVLGQDFFVFPLTKKTRTKKTIKTTTTK